MNSRISSTCPVVSFTLPNKHSIAETTSTKYRTAIKSDKLAFVDSCVKLQIGAFSKMSNALDQYGNGFPCRPCFLL